MKLASIRDGSRDGQLAVVSRDLRTAQFASGITGTLQRVLDDWNFFLPQLQDLYEALNAGRARHPFAFDPSRAAAPMPRAFQFVAPDADGTLQQRTSDQFLGAHDAPETDSEATVAAHLAVITGDVPLDLPHDAAIDAARLFLLGADWHLPARVMGDVTLPARQYTAFAPVAVTADELAGAWKRGKIHLPLHVSRNGKVIGRPDTGSAMRQGFPMLIAALAQSRPASAGSIVGGGHLAGLDEKASKGSTATTLALNAGDRVRLELLDTENRSVFGAIEQGMAATTPPPAADSLDLELA